MPAVRSLNIAARSLPLWIWLSTLLLVVFFLGVLHRIDIMFIIGALLTFGASLLKVWAHRGKPITADVASDMLRYWGVTVAFIAVLCRDFVMIFPRLFP